MSERNLQHRFAGIHVSGPNAQKTAVVVVTAGGQTPYFQVEAVYERIGSNARTFSDERVLDIIQNEGPFAALVVDCPLSEPPCVVCTRPVCPGVNHCEDVSVAYMQALARKWAPHRRRPINPQTQRLWDVMRYGQPGTETLEPTYSSNHGPLVTRARTLLRRLRSLDPDLVFKETAVAQTLLELAKILNISAEVSVDYRSFETGRQTREYIVESLVEQGILQEITDSGLYYKITHLAENFQAFIAALVAVFDFCGQCQKFPDFPAEQGDYVRIPIAPSSTECAIES